jgi:hypothetical protein
MPAESGYRTPEEYAIRVNTTIDEVWRQLEDGRLPAVILAEIRDLTTGERVRFDYTAISDEVVRGIRSGLLDDVFDYTPKFAECPQIYKHVVIKANQEAIRILVDPNLTPQFFKGSRKQAPDWKSTARQIGTKWMNNQQRQNGKLPTVTEIAKFVEGELSNRGITGARGCFPDAETIKREALTGITGRKRGYNLRK